MSTLRLAVKFMLLTLVRKTEFIEAKWDEVNFETAIWTIPKDRMKAGRPHNVYLSQQALDILVAFKTCFSASSYLHPGRYETELQFGHAEPGDRRHRESGPDRGEDFDPSPCMICAARLARYHEPGFSTATGSRNASREQRCACYLQQGSTPSSVEPCFRPGLTCWMPGSK
jgi:hypothetical protein